MTPDVWIVIPARNESHRLPSALATLDRFLDERPDHGVVIAADGGSSDDTASIAERWATGNERVRAVRAQGGSKWIATLAGVRAAGDGVIVTADADLSVRPSDLSGLVAAARDGALAIGSRALPGAARIGEPLGRRALSLAFNAVVRGLAIASIRDTQCGSKAFRRDVGLDLLERVRVRGWAFDVELIALAIADGTPVVEVPVRWTYRTGSSVRPLRDGPSVVWDLWSIRRRFGGRPSRPGPRPRGR